MKTFLIAVTVASFTLVSTNTAFANKQIKDQFLAIYAGDEADEDFKELVGKAKCYVCHVKKESKKKVRNPYGTALHDALEKDEFPVKDFKKNPEEFAERLAGIFKSLENAKSGDSSHKTFADRMKAKLLPGGNVDGKKDDVNPGDEPGEWITMFDGKSLDGWKVNENPDSWKVQDGTLVCKGPRAHLFFTGEEKPFKNFHFKAEVKTTKGSNSGIYFHTRFQDNGWPKYGYECQVNVSHTDKKKSSGLYSVDDVADPGVKDDEWYTQEIIVNGRNIELKINGKTLVNHTEPEGKDAFSKDFERRLGEGTFALQSHDPDSVVYFRNLSVKRLP